MTTRLRRFSTNGWAAISAMTRRILYLTVFQQWGEGDIRDLLTLTAELIHQRGRME
jgi:hypothetical protein